MTKFCEHTAAALAIGSVYVPEILIALTRAHDSEGARRLEQLYEAQEHAMRLVTEIQVAIATETRENPTAARLVGRHIRAVVNTPSPRSDVQEQLIASALIDGMKERSR